MKLKCFILLTLVLNLGCQSNSPKTKVPPTQKSVVEKTVGANKRVSLTIEGMVCAMGCAAVIEKKLNATPGIAKATVDFPSKKALVEYDGGQINPNEIIEVVKKVGNAYAVSEFTLE